MHNKAFKYWLAALMAAAILLRITVDSLIVATEREELLGTKLFFAIIGLIVVTAVLVLKVILRVAYDSKYETGYSPCQRYYH